MYESKERAETRRTRATIDEMLIYGHDQGLLLETIGSAIDALKGFFGSLGESVGDFFGFLNDLDFDVDFGGFDG